MARLCVTLGDPHAKLRRLAEQAHVQEETLAGSLLAHALDEAGTDTKHVGNLFDAVPGAFERARLGLEEARRGETVSLDEL